MSIFRDFFVKEKPVFTGIARGLGGFGLGLTVGGGGGGGTGPLSLSGGTKIPAATAGDGYTYHVFTGTDTWENVSGNAGVVDILLVAGGASGGLSGGGGGAGGVAFGNSFPIGHSDGPYTITVGSGGASTPYPSSDARGNDGTDTTFNFNGGSYIARRGGGGGKGNSGPGPSNNAPNAGGSGGGVGRDNPGSTAGAVYSPQPSNPFFTRYGNTGGTSPNSGGGSGGGGGGGAGEAGKNNKPAANGGDGGHGILIPAFPAPVIAPAIPSLDRTNFTNAVRHYGAYGGGGGGGGYQYGGSSGGNGGGGWGDAGDLGGGGPSVAQPGADYTGGGGGGSGGSNGGVSGSTGKGGDGLCVIRYTENTTKATGGFVSYIGSKTVHAFTRNCGMTQFTNPTVLTVDVVAVGGGGAGGTVQTSASSGGGGGGVYYRTGYSLPAAAHNISIGAGGTNATAGGGDTTMSPNTIAASATGGNKGYQSVGTGANSGGYPSNGNAASGPYLFSKGSGSSSSGNASGGGGGAESNGINAGGDCGSYAGCGGGGKPFTNVATIEIKLGSGGGGGNRCAPGGTNTAGAGGDNAAPYPTVGGWNISTWNRNQGGPGASENYSAGATQGPQSNAIAGLSRVGNYGLPGTGSGGGGTHQYTNESASGGFGGDGILYVLYDT